MKVFVEEAFIPKDDLPKLSEKFPNIIFVYNMEENKDIDLFFGSNSILRKVNLDDYRNLKWIQLFMAGFDDIDIDGIKNRGIIVSNARDIFSISIAEDIIGKILFFNRQTKALLSNMKEKKWQPIWRNKELYNSTIGIIGTGSIGQETAKRLQAFSPKKIIGYRRHNKPVQYFDQIYTGEEDLDYLFKTSDYLILAMPLNEDTRYIVNKKKLLMMKESALLINVARGQVIVQEDLIEILEGKKIRGAALDVTDPEPLPSKSKLWELDNVFISPHNASSSEYMTKRLFELTMSNLEKYLDNKEIDYRL